MNGKAIARNEWGDLYYQELPKEFFEIGDVALISDLSPISDLSVNEQEDIEMFVSEMLAEQGFLGD